MFWLLISLFIFVAGAIGALLLYRHPRIARWIGSSTLFIGSLLAFFPVFSILITGEKESFELPWTLPMSSFSLVLDRLSAFFMFPLFLLSAGSAVYAIGYTEKESGSKKNAFMACWLNLLVASMALVLLANNFILFLLVWELMALFSFFLVIEEDEKEEVRHAGWVYLVAAHIGTAALIALFVFIGSTSGSFNFDSSSLTTPLPKALFILAIVGFGAKAGFMPFHVWLPSAHASAPSYVSALMSGVMIKTAIYALLRTLILIGFPPHWWGWSLLIIGASSAILGALLALSQDDFKKVLAYSSIENMGIITLGLGIGFLGISYQVPLMALLGFCGALYHVINHALFKGLLFFAGGAIYLSTHTREMGQLGGLIKKMKGTALGFLIGCLAISALPPFNGFVSEFLLFLGCLQSIHGSFENSSLFALLSIGSLSLVGGLSLFCFTRAFGFIFLGQARTNAAEKAQEVSLFLRIPIYILSALTLLFGLLSPFILNLLFSSLSSIIEFSQVESQQALSFSQNALTMVLLFSSLLIFLVTLLLSLRHHLLKKRQTEVRVTWDCGYVKPQARMQYVPSSFSEPIVSLFRWILRAKNSNRMSQGFFPTQTTFSMSSNDFAEELGYRPLFRGVKWSFSKLRWLQGGSLQLYILYIALTLLALLIWKT